jgi:hypothetical protein
MGPQPRPLRIMHTPSIIPEMSGSDCVALDIIITHFHTVQNVRYLVKKTISEQKIDDIYGTCELVIFQFNEDLRQLGVNLSP